MNKLARTLVTFASFIIMYFLVMRVHQDVNGPDALQFVVVWIVFLSMTAVSFYQWEASYLFGSFVYLYAIMILMKAGISWETAIGTMLTRLMTTAVNNWRIPGFAKLLSISSILQKLANLVTRQFGRIRKTQVLGRLKKMAGVKKLSGNISESDIQEIQKVEFETTRVKSFFDGSDPTLENILCDTLEQIEKLQKEHARLVLRSAHLETLLRTSSHEQLKIDISKINSEIEFISDPVVKSQTLVTVQMKQRRLQEIEKQGIFLERLKIQRHQILETIVATFDKLNSLKFSDVQILKASGESLSEEIRQLQNGLEDMEESIIFAESIRGSTS